MSWCLLFKQKKKKKSMAARAVTVPDEVGQPDNLDEPISKLCLKPASTKDCNTLNLTSHLNVNPPLTYTDFILQHPPNKVKRRPAPSVNQPGILGAFAKTTKYRWDSAR